MIDVAAGTGIRGLLVDNLWDKPIGRKRIEELSKYAQSKKVSLMFWYISNGFKNDAPQTPRQIMNNAIARKKEMAWMKKIGVVGIKVDFFGGDKQETMKLYEDILSDANDYGLEVIFHGCTMPRGWERCILTMYPARLPLASENVLLYGLSCQEGGFRNDDASFLKKCRSQLRLGWRDDEQVFLQGQQEPSSALYQRYLRDGYSYHQPEQRELYLSISYKLAGCSTVGAGLAEECSYRLGGYQVYRRLSYEICGSSSQGWQSGTVRAQLFWQANGLLAV